jgi:hypothetical protein
MWLKPGKNITPFAATRTRCYAHSLLRALAATRTRLYAHSLLRALAATRTRLYAHSLLHALSKAKLFCISCDPLCFEFYENKSQTHGN